MKLKHLLVMAAVAVGSSAWAQEDVTSTYLVNPSFELKAEGEASTAAALSKTGGEYYGWSLPNLGDSYANVSIGSSSACDGNGFGIPSAASEGSYYFFNRKGWGTQAGEISQTASLPAGKYYISVDYKAYERTSTNGTIGISINGNSIFSTKPYYATNSNTGTWAVNDPWKTIGAWFTVEEAGDVKIAITENLVGGSARADLYLDNVKLYKWDLNDDNNYDNASADMPFDVTNLVKNPYFDSNVNDWTSTTGYQNKGRATNQGGAISGGFFENWNGSAKESGKMSQTVTGLKDGLYRLTAAVSTNNSANISLFIGDSKTAVGDNTSAFYSVEGPVAGGSVEIGLELGAGNAANWIGLDNIKLEYIGYDLASAIEAVKAAAQAAESLKTTKCYTGYITELSDAIEAIYALDAETATKADVEAASDNLANAIANVNASATDYQNLKNAIDQAPNYKVVNPDNVSIYSEAISEASDVYDNGSIEDCSEISNIFSGFKVEDYNWVTDNYTQAVETTWSAAAGASGQHWDGTATSKYYDKWNGTAMSEKFTSTVTLPAGEYVMMSAGRGQAGTKTYIKVGEERVNFTNKGDVGYGIDINGAANFSEGTYANNNTGRGWEYRFITFTLEEKTEVALECGYELNNGTWASVCVPQIFKVAETASAVMAVNATAQYGTFCAPFDVEVPEGVTASTATIGEDGKTINLESVGATIPAYTPVILFAETGLEATTFNGIVEIGEPAESILTGVYEATPAPVGSYVLQMHGDKVGFFKVDDVIPTVGANRCYLNADASEAKAFYFASDDATAIKAIDALAGGNIEGIYTTNGVKVNSLQKGINIIKTADGKTQKVLVK